MLRLDQACGATRLAMQGHQAAVQRLRGTGRAGRGGGAGPVLHNSGHPGARLRNPPPASRHSRVQPLVSAAPPRQGAK